ncbi:hypothetical protein B0H66DRAFT_166530 [Apodospora peruviana]|uniref:FAD-binding PCMH-type domain-containing protein n=1 Tax=Apodospora peruviana TaxID=516989 RepID=A0AAE0IK64_9PEZI|nr:hypothetical protein B0H66DRAFT_166530 [Apodospora peruviana]
MRLTAIITLLGSFAVASRAAAKSAPPTLFPYETDLLTSDDVGNFSDIAPASDRRACIPKTECRAFPGSADWPKDAEWEQLNVALGGGALLEPVPAAAACYPGTYQNATACTTVVNNQFLTRQYFDDPLAISTQWPAGNACPAVAQPTGDCRQGGYPVYVVNATSVKQIQIAVNFARNKNLRLVVKNTGHDFVGRSTGAGALSIWTHHLKGPGFELLHDYVHGQYRGKAAHVAVGLEAWEVHAAMAKYNVALVAPSFATVGLLGGYMQGGGHSALVSYHGLASDQVLSLNVVTADGSFVTADPDTNSDLFFALRGGGGGTYGIVTSAVVKAHPFLEVTTAAIALSSLDVGIEPFWRAMSAYFAFGHVIADAGGIDRNYVSPLNNNTVFNFTTSFEFPNMTAAAVAALLLPLDAAFKAAGVNVTFPAPATSLWSAEVIGEGAPVRDERFASRLIPRAVWDDPAKFKMSMEAFRKVVEGGYQIHGTMMSPSLKVAGWPGKDSAANPAFRSAVMHCVVYDFVKGTPATAAADLAGRARLSQYVDYIRAATPGSGSYMNEADVIEPNWQQSFFGSNYKKLEGIKKKYDAWGLFWAPSTVGSERWAVRTAGGVPTQDGKLCRTLEK